MRFRTVLFFFSLLLFISVSYPVTTFAASLFVNPSEGTFNVGDSFSVDIYLDTGGEDVSGVTAMLTFDPKKLQVSDDSSTTEGIQITPGTIFNQVLSNSVDLTLGKIRFDSGSLGKVYNGRGKYATIHFVAKSPGTSSVNFIFDPNSTTDSSLVAAASGAKNLLTSVRGGTYIVSGQEDNTLTARSTPTYTNTGNTTQTMSSFGKPLSNTLLLVGLSNPVLGAGLLIFKLAGVGILF